ncbi:MAG: S8 family serine peptidase [Candidatus Krumholzibacteriia bacterium]
MKNALALACLLCLVLGVTAAAVAQPDPAKTGPGSRALADPAGAAMRSDGTVKVWVRLVDRDLAGPSLAAALADRARELPARTLQRRARVTPAGRPLVTVGDLPVDAVARAAVAATGARIDHESRWLNALSVRATDLQLVALAALPVVERMELVATFRRPTPPVDSAERDLARAIMAEARARGTVRDGLDYGGSLAGLEQINVPAVHAMGVTGAGVVVGMLDTGFKTTHEALQSVTVLARHDFINDDDVVENEPGDPASQHDHGTKTLSTIMGFKDGALVGPAFGASVILAKTEDTSAEYPAEEDNWVAGLEWVEALGADVVSSSLGYYDWYEFADLDGNTAVTTIAADLAVGRGLVVVNSAGNERGSGFGHIIAPADGDSVITVGAVNLTGAIAGFSSPGPTYDGRIKPDVSAQGVSNHVVSASNDAGYSLADGTSFSCPLTAGVAALVLSRVPGLTPLQVREALRQTADRAQNPDNDYGWGIVDAHAAVTYWGAVFTHTPLGDTEDTADPIAVSATVTGRLPLDPAHLDVVWRADGGPWQRAALAPAGGDLFTAHLPAQPANTDVAYYLESTDAAAVTTRLPVAGAASPFGFHVGPDQSAPVLVHTPLGDQPLVTWPPLVACTASDNLGIDRVELELTHDGGAVMGPYLLAAGGDGGYTLAFPLPADQLAIGDPLTYRLTAFDASGSQLSTTTGWLGFEIVDTLGVLLVIDDTGLGLRDAKLDEHKRVLPAVTGRSAAGDLAGWLQEAGYVADVIAAADVTDGAFTGYQAVISAGDNTSPLATSALRDALAARQTGGRLLVEGGEVGYDALSSPGYPAFAAAVLHAVSWQTDNAGALQVAAGQGTHPLMIRPHALPASIPLVYDSYGDEDAITPAPDATLVMGTANHGGSAGVLAFDDDPAPQAGQIVVYAFNIAAVAPAVGRQLAENGAAYLLADQPPATAAISGTVSVVGGAAAGVAVALSGGATEVTGDDGRYAFTDLYGGIYTVTASKAGYTTAVRQAILEDGQLLGAVDLELLPVIQVDYAASPGVAIPDNDPAGVVSLITVDAAGPLSSLTVDIAITHPYVGDLSVTLFSPAGSIVVLHNRSGGSAGDLVGNWPGTLQVDGPGALADLGGEEVAGVWALHVVDHAGSDTGMLQSWGLHLEIPDPVTDADAPSAVTRLLGNRPNPFNPSTTLAFELARPGAVRLELFDVGGRLVRRLVDGPLAAGRHEVDWDGRDAAGREQASGVYLARLVADGTRQSGRLVLVR